MKSVKHLVPELLDAYPLLLYQGVRGGRWQMPAVEALLPMRRLLLQLHHRYRSATAGNDWFQLQSPGPSHPHPPAIRRVPLQACADAKRHIIRARALREESGCCLCEDSREGATQQAGGSISSGKLQLGGQEQGRLHIELNDRQQQHQQQQRWQWQLQTDHRHQQQQGPNKHEEASGDKVVAYWKRSGRLTHVVLSEAGHMVPRDAPQAGRCMLERWLHEAL